MRSRTPPTRWRRAVLLASLLLAAAACSVDDPAPAPGDAAPEEGFVVEQPAVPAVRVTPAESAAAAGRIRAHTDSVQRAVRVQAGLPAEDARVSPAASAHDEPTAEAEYAGCMAQARVAEGHTREVIERACERRRQAPPASAP